mmetsp:Transcript_31117/g.75204  ORF Transcript_31117/g.75204 Transcript_31117/m.75204 type:complete len:212 (-) Transcript_31117:542-1177(-)
MSELPGRFYPNFPRQTITHCQFGASKIKSSLDDGGGSLFEKYDDANASCAVQRLFGSSTSNDLRRIMAPADGAEMTSSRGIPGTVSHNSPRWTSGSVVWSGQFVSVGLPITVKIVSSCAMSLSTGWGKIGRRSISSAKIQPTDHMSAAALYSQLPNNSSGGLYHNVIAWGDNLVFGVPYSLASPKSASFIVPSLRNRQLSGLRSRCKIHRS